MKFNVQDINSKLNKIVGEEIEFFPEQSKRNLIESIKPQNLIESIKSDIEDTWSKLQKIEKIQIKKPKQMNEWFDGISKTEKIESDMAMKEKPKEESKITMDDDFIQSININNFEEIIGTEYEGIGQEFVSDGQRYKVTGVVGDDVEVRPIDDMKEAKSSSDLVNKMRETAKKAARARLAGKMQDAQSLDREIEKIYRQAKSQGVEEDDLVSAEEEGRESARSMGEEKLPNLKPKSKKQDFDAIFESIVGNK